MVRLRRFYQGACNGIKEATKVPIVSLKLLKDIVLNRETHGDGSALIIKVQSMEEC